MKYNKYWSKIYKAILYIIIAIIFVGLNIALTCLSFTQDAENRITNITLVIISFILETAGFIYFVIQDLISTTKSVKFFKQMDEDTNGRKNIPFVDRTILIKEIVAQTMKGLSNNEYYYETNIKYGEKNGKYSFARRLAYEFEWLRDKTGKPVSEIDRKRAKRLGCIYFIDYSKHNQNFEEYVKGLLFIKNKKNIVIVNNYFSTEDYWTDRLVDKDIFFIKLNYLEKAEDKLLFPDDKIFELLNELKKMPQYQSKLIDTDLNLLSKKLGQLSKNNIGNLINILDSEEFKVLIETDALFIDFYLELKNAKYTEAKEKYDKINISKETKNIYRYKFSYEGANLNHFLGSYETAFDELQVLDSQLCADGNTFSNILGCNLHFDIILLQSHIQKHMGNFIYAKRLLNDLNDDYRNLIWLRSNFAVDIFSLNELNSESDEWKELLNGCLTNMNKFNNQRNEYSKDSNYYFYEVFYPIAAFYESNFNLHIINNLIKIEEEAINYYENNERRFLTNCLFIKAELLRISGDIMKAKEYYSRCYQVYLRNGDKDILYLVAITEEYIRIFYNLELEITDNLETVLKMCKKENGYAFHNRLITDLNEAQTNDVSLIKIKKHFENTINPIP